MLRETAQRGLQVATVRDARVAEICIGKHDGFNVINGRTRATFEHPFFIRRDGDWGFCSAEMLAVGDYLITQVNGAPDEERIESLERIDGVVRTVAIHVPGTSTYLAEGVWTHNNANAVFGGSSGLTSHFSGGSSKGSSSSSSSKSSSSSFTSSSGISGTGFSTSASA